MWQRFTEEMRRVVLQSLDEATRAQSSNVDTEHLLLGLLVQNQGRVGRLLERANLNVSALRAEATNAVTAYPHGQQDIQPKLTSSAKRVLESATGEARRAYHTAVAPEHLLLALLGEIGGRASQILRAQGADADKTYAAVMEEIAVQAPHWAIPSHKEMADEALLLSLLERRTDLLVEILGLDVLALKKARLKLLLRLDSYEEAAILRDEIESEHS